MELKYFFLPLVASISFFLVGYDSAVTKYGWTAVQKNLHVTNRQADVAVCVSDVAAIVSVVVAGLLADRFGRKYTLAATGGFFFLGNLLKSFSISSYPLLFAGQLLSGFGVGLVLTIAPLYIAEMSPAPTRGLLTSAPEVWLNMGIIFGYKFYSMFSRFPAGVGQRVMFLIAVFPSVLLTSCMCLMPESPYWLIMRHQQVNEATQILERTRRSQTETNHIVAQLGLEANNNNNTRTRRIVWRDFIQLPQNRRIVLTVAGLNVLRQLSGVDTLTAHAVLVIYDNVSTKLLDVANGVVLMLRAVSVMCSSLVVDRVGRRFLLLASMCASCCFLMMFGLPVVAVQHGLIAASESDSYEVVVVGLCLLGIAGIACSFEAGLGPITWIHTAEAFKCYRLRAQGIGFAVVVNRVAEIVFVLSSRPLAGPLRIGGVSLVFFVVMALGLPFCSYFVKDQGEEILE
ncbi:unnamed protein product [Linum trigynum]|uniref:Major facilitator superfamily (MFS) profile domain-containing protein n=1 Tax=Linum trigynum TaxID=586398 RepID=A0AAV2GI63_9ROSI